jgi:hypothetical protein
MFDKDGSTFKKEMKTEYKMPVKLHNQKKNLYQGNVN